MIKLDTMGAKVLFPRAQVKPDWLTRDAFFAGA